METESHSTTKLWEKEFALSQKNHPAETVLNTITPVGQSEAYSCGTAVLASITGRKEEELIDHVKNELEKNGLLIEHTGTPPRIMMDILNNNGIVYRERPSDISYEAPFVEDAIRDLKTALKAGRICLTPIQSTPELYLAKVTRDAEGKIIQSVIKTESMWIDELGDDEYNRQRTTKLLQTPRASLKQKHPKSTANEVDVNGHWIAVVGMMKKGGRTYFITVDPWYKNEQETIKTIDPAQTGYRLIDEKHFGHVWHDRSGDGENYNQYMIAVDAPNKEI